MSHTCHAKKCATRIPPKLFMCLKHWKMVPKPLQDRIWATYVPGQEVRKDPTPAYLDAADEAIAAVAAKEGL